MVDVKILYSIPQAVSAEISRFLHSLLVEEKRNDFNRAALQTELLLSSRLENQNQVANAQAKVSVCVSDLVEVFLSGAFNHFINLKPVLSTFFLLYASEETTGTR